MTYTERIPGMLEDQAKAQGITVAEAEQQMADRNTIRHIVDAREIAYVIAFLASPKSISINGDAIATAGGIPRAIHY
jgi:NAD(P)-dependent dehydrogenase (short-subunit alcohol dehydrogenase family)